MKSKLLDHFIELIPVMIIVAVYTAMAFVATDFEVSILLLIGGLLLGLIMGAMDIKILPLRPLVIIYTVTSIGAFFYITYRDGFAKFSPEDLIITGFFIVTILVMVLVSRLRENNPNTYILEIIIDWYCLILLFIFLFALYYLESKALVDSAGNGQEDLQACTFFSCVTFTGLGYGDIVPRPAFRMVAAMQSIIGYICMGGVAATIYSLIQAKLQELHKGRRSQDTKKNDCP
ncbi:MAG: potassium channel family protein [Victivallaceae bacterium]|nr:potassium channel family protein [Victivallaceae bacterium]